MIYRFHHGSVRGFFNGFIGRRDDFFVGFCRLRFGFFVLFVLISVQNVADKVRHTLGNTVVVFLFFFLFGDGIGLFATRFRNAFRRRAADIVCGGRSVEDISETLLNVARFFFVAFGKVKRFLQSLRTFFAAVAVERERLAVKRRFYIFFAVCVCRAESNGFAAFFNFFIVLFAVKFFFCALTFDVVGIEDGFFHTVSGNARRILIREQQRESVFCLFGLVGTIFVQISDKKFVANGLFDNAFFARSVGNVGKDGAFALFIRFDFG